jgi:hypothetical protein
MIRADPAATNGGRVLFWSTAPVGGMVCDHARGHSGQFGKLIHLARAGPVKFASIARIFGVLRWRCSFLAPTAEPWHSLVVRMHVA